MVEYKDPAHLYPLPPAIIITLVQSSVVPQAGMFTWIPSKCCPYTPVLLFIR